MTNERGSALEGHINVRLSVQQLQSVDTLVRKIRRQAGRGVAVRRSDVIRMALDRGVAALLDEYPAVPEQPEQVLREIAVGDGLLDALVAVARGCRIDVRPFRDSAGDRNRRLAHPAEPKGFLWAHARRRFLRVHLWEPDASQRPVGLAWSPLREQGEWAGPDYTWARVEPGDSLESLLSYVRTRSERPRTGHKA